MKYDRLVVNGCSYMQAYALGGGHRDLSNSLGFKSEESLALGGSANNRIIRTTLKHSYQTDQPTFYLIGTTFILRHEVPILEYGTHEEELSTFEGRWTNPQNQHFSSRWIKFWKQKDTDKFVDLKLKSEVYSFIDYAEDFMYRLLSMINDLQSRGHQILVYNQAELTLLGNLRENLPLLETKRLELLKTNKHIVEGLSWVAVPWQHEQGVPFNTEATTNPKYPPPADNIRHRKFGHHQRLNEYLINYIQEHKILA